MTAPTRRVSRIRRLHSQAGAFDLPSILVGVVVVGILTAGVLAAIFGVIPYTQDNVAKQDLAAINTAQGVTYAKDGQTYKDLDGLDRAGLVSGLDPETTEVTVSDAGKGFEAIVTAGNGNRWMISHKNNVPVLLTGPAAPGVPEGEVAWATGYCTPAVEKYMEMQLSVFQHQGYFEMERERAGFEPDRKAIKELMELVAASEMNPDDHPYTYEEYVVMEQLLKRMQARISVVVVDSSDQWPEWKDVVFGDLRSEYKSYCAMYRGLPAFEYYPSRAPADAIEWQPGSTSMTIPAGSTEPFVISFPYGYDPKQFAVASERADSVPGFESGVLELIDVDGSPYMTYTMTPDAGGWRSGGGHVEFGVTSTANDPYDVGHFWSSLAIYVE